MELTCEQLGITPDDIADRVATKIASTMLAKVVPDYDDETGAEFDTDKPTAFAEMVRKRVARKVEQAVESIADKRIGQNIAGRLEDMRFPQTNHYGEVKAEPLTLLEFIDRRVSTYLSENVDSEGRSGGNSYGDKSRTRVVWMLEKYLAEQMKGHFQKALANANQQIVDGIAKTMKDKLAEVAAKLSVQVKV